MHSWPLHTRELQSLRNGLWCCAPPTPPGPCTLRIPRGLWDRGHVILPNTQVCCKCSHFRRVKVWTTPTVGLSDYLIWLFSWILQPWWKHENKKTMWNHVNFTLTLLNLFLLWASIIKPCEEYFECFLIISIQG